MNNCFLTVVVVLSSDEEVEKLPTLFKGLKPTLEAGFSDFEVILVNNTLRRDFSEYLVGIPEAFKRFVYMLNLSSPVVKNHAIVAGLDRSNGDYTVIYEKEFWDKPEIINELYRKSNEGFDIVYLQASRREDRFYVKPFYKIFYGILRKYSDLKVDDRAHDTRIISRRALNSLLRLRENLRYMKAIYSIVGYRTSFIKVDTPIRHDETRFTDKFRTSLIAITSFTSFLRTLFLWIFLVSIGFLVLVIVNAVKVKLTNYDLLGSYHDAIPGWTFLVVLSSIFFALTCLMLYIMSIYLDNIYQEIKHRPMYIIESVQRF